MSSWRDDGVVGMLEDMASSYQCRPWRLIGTVTTLMCLDNHSLQEHQRHLGEQSRDDKIHDDHRARCAGYDILSRMPLLSV
nr:hypothetical protein CFP56_73166 [Quercus suber]